MVAVDSHHWIPSEYCSFFYHFYAVHFISLQYSPYRFSLAIYSIMIVIFYYSAFSIFFIYPLDICYYLLHNLYNINNIIKVWYEDVPLAPVPRDGTGTRENVFLDRSRDSAQSVFFFSLFRSSLPPKRAGTGTREKILSVTFFPAQNMRKESFFF